MINLIMKIKKILEQISNLSKEQILAENKLNELLHIIPNLAQESVPIGKR